MTIKNNNDYMKSKINPTIRRNEENIGIDIAVTCAEIPIIYYIINNLTDYE